MKTKKNRYRDGIEQRYDGGGIEEDKEQTNKKKIPNEEEIWPGAPHPRVSVTQRNSKLELVHSGTWFKDNC